MLILVVMAIFFLLVVFSPKITLINSEDEEIARIKTELHQYSGLNPDIYIEFINSIELMEKSIYSDTDLATYYLYKSIDSAQNIALYATGINTYVIDDINRLTIELGVRGEKLILDQALLKGDRFRPTYLNNLHEI
jgi:hypothetical protein